MGAGWGGKGGGAAGLLPPTQNGPSPPPSPSKTPGEELEGLKAQKQEPKRETEKVVPGHFRWKVTVQLWQRLGAGRRRRRPQRLQSVEKTHTT